MVEMAQVVEDVCDVQIRRSAVDCAAPIYVHNLFCVLTALCAFSFLNIFTDHKYNENLTHAQTTSTGPA